MLKIFKEEELAWVWVQQLCRQVRCDNPRRHAMGMIARRSPHNILAMNLNPNLQEWCQEKKPFPGDSPKHVNATWDHVFCAGDTQPLGNGIAYLLYTCQIAVGQWWAADLEVKSSVSNYISQSHLVRVASYFITAVNHKYWRQTMQQFIQSDK